MTHLPEVQKRINLINSLSDQSYFGSLLFKFEHGKIVHIRKEHNIKPSELSELTEVFNERTTSNS
jgi:hypothetical protein